MTRGYAEIAEHFRVEIRSGNLRPGDRLPTVKSVMEQFDVSNNTAVRAYKVLKKEGLTTSARGAGTVVAHHGSDNIAARVRTFAATGKALAANETSEIIEVGTVSAEEAVASRLDIEPGTPVQVRRRLVSRDGVPVHLSSSFYPSYVMEVAPELAQKISTGGSRELAAERLGAKQGHVLEEVTARLATDPEKSALGLTGAVIVTQVARTVFLTDGRVVEVAIKVVSGSTVLRWSTSLTEDA
ncbi:GntR family transcriptional regulator [Streptomyces sp. MP131-18]|uniref:GntR family transcriptional regulator n=1 Tax=Streptomyces sp. MP131-18 TaxID=1857892 RepID=UPI00097BF120|nr:GntR family transcriptional regulator [Streptomyces sp. MP131-18]ONK09226.1 HTH-type transcriptional repressor YvoA [Streptomyces sp. MP131-18]